MEINKVLNYFVYLFMLISLNFVQNGAAATTTSGPNENSLWAHGCH
jgi:hypothetical protein